MIVTSLSLQSIARFFTRADRETIGGLFGMPKQKSKPCKCSIKIDKILAERGCVMVTPITFNPDTARRAMIWVDKKHDAPRGTKVMRLVATFCPFCGEKYPE